MNERNRSAKQILVEEAGGACKHCGYCRSMAGLCFHHIDPSKKEFAMSGRVSGRLAELREEVKKCLLLCHNCHTELHAGIWSIQELTGS